MNESYKDTSTEEEAKGTKEETKNSKKKKKEKPKKKKGVTVEAISHVLLKYNKKSV